MCTTSCPFSQTTPVLSPGRGQRCLVLQMPNRRPGGQGPARPRRAEPVWASHRRAFSSPFRQRRLSLFARLPWRERPREGADSCSGNRRRGERRQRGAAGAGASVHHVLGRGLCLFSLPTAISGSPLAPLVMQLVQLGFKPVGGSGSPLVSLMRLHSGLFLDSGPACPPARSPQGLSAPHPGLEASTGDPPAPPHLSPSLCRPQALSGCFPCGQQFLLIARGHHGQLGALLPHTRGVREAEPRAPAGVDAKARGGLGLSACRAPGRPSWEPTLFLGCQHDVSLACSLGHR